MTLTGHPLGPKCCGNLERHCQHSATLFALVTCCHWAPQLPAEQYDSTHQFRNCSNVLQSVGLRPPAAAPQPPYAPRYTQPPTARSSNDPLGGHCRPLGAIGTVGVWLQARCSGVRLAESLASASARDRRGFWKKKVPNKER